MRNPHFSRPCKLAHPSQRLRSGGRILYFEMCQHGRFGSVVVTAAVSKVLSLVLQHGGCPPAGRCLSGSLQESLKRTTKGSYSHCFPTASRMYLHRIQFWVCLQLTGDIRTCLLRLSPSPPSLSVSIVPPKCGQRASQRGQALLPQFLSGF